MGAQTDFEQTIDRAAGLITDADTAVRSADSRPIPDPHDVLLKRAKRGLQDAQHALFTARSLPWTAPKTERQLELL